MKEASEYNDIYTQERSEVSLVKKTKRKIL